MISFTVVGSAEPAGSKRVVPVGGRFRAIDANWKAAPWKSLVAETAARAYDGELLDGPLVVEFTFYRPRPRGHFGKRGLRPSAPEFPTVRPDVLKLSRGVEDALAGVIYRDDSQIIAEHLFKLYGEPARCVVKVWEAGESPYVLGLAAA